MRAALVLAAMVSSTALAAAGNPYLGQVKGLFEARRWERCLERVELARQRWSNAPDDEAQLELYAGLCRLGLGHELDAQLHLARALRIDLTLHLPLGTGPRVELFFERVRARVRASPAGAEEEAPVEPAQPEPPKEEAPAPAVSLSERLSKQHLVAPLSLAGAGLVGVVVGAVLGAEAKRLEGQANRALFESEIYRFGNAAKADATGANVSFAVAGAAAVAAVVVWWLLN